MPAKNRIEIIISGEDRASKVLGGVGKGLAGLGKIAAGAGLAVAGAATGIGVALGALAVQAAPLEGIGFAFDKMSERVGLSLDDLREASAGTISDFELMRKANIALTGAGDQLGVEFGKNMPALLEAARAAARATGQDVDFLFESLVTGVKRGSPMLIDNTARQDGAGTDRRGKTDRLAQRHRRGRAAHGRRVRGGAVDRRREDGAVPGHAPEY
jgi:hypothetical protein